ncbi:MAG: transglycosylase SLT domain-containing protein [Dehalococcoidia bacterium]
MGAIEGITPIVATQQVSAVGAAGAARAVGAATSGGEAFDAVLSRHLSQPRSDIAAIRSEIAAIRSGAGFSLRAPSAGGGDEGSASISTAGFASIPGWLDAQLAAQATGDTVDPYGWRGASREIAERIIGPGYGALFERQIDQESGFNPDVVYGVRVSTAGAEGIAQLMPQYYPNVNRTDPISGLTAGAETMRHYLNAWDGDVRKALASYNAGLGRVQSLVNAHGANWEAGLPAETRSYLAAILGDAAPVYTGGSSSSSAVFGGRGAGGVLTAPLAGAVEKREGTLSVDYFGAAGAAVQSPTDGVVVEASPGRLVLDHGNGWRTVLEGVSPEVGVGASVKRSQAIGALGSGGQLRLGVTVNGQAVNPAPYLLQDV